MCISTDVSATKLNTWVAVITVKPFGLQESGGREEGEKRGEEREGEGREGRGGKG